MVLTEHDAGAQSAGDAFVGSRREKMLVVALGAKPQGVNVVLINSVSCELLLVGFPQIEVAAFVDVYEAGFRLW